MDEIYTDDDVGHHDGTKGGFGLSALLLLLLLVRCEKWLPRDTDWWDQ